MRIYVRVWLAFLALISAGPLSGALSVSIDHLAATSWYDNVQEGTTFGQTFVAVDSNVAGMVVLVDDPNHPGTDMATLEGPARLVIYDATSLIAPVLLHSTQVVEAGASVRGQLTLLFNTPVPTSIGTRYFIGIEHSDSYYGLGIRDIYVSTYPGGAESYIPNGTSSITVAGSGRDVSFQILARTGPLLAPPLDQIEISGLQFGDPWPECQTSRACDSLATQGRGRDFQHTGIDLFAVAGDPVYASADGIVMALHPSLPGGIGGAVVLLHDSDGDAGTNDDRFTTLYEHVDPDLLLELGAAVVAGDQIATVSSIQAEFGDHLHFGVRAGSYPASCPDLALNGALPPAGAIGCRACSSPDVLPEFPDGWTDPLPLLSQP